VPVVSPVEWRRGAARETGSDVLISEGKQNTRVSGVRETHTCLQLRQPQECLGNQQ